MTRPLLRIITIALLSAVAGTAWATNTDLPLRSEPGTCVYNGTATQTIETSFGTAQAQLPFTGTATWDFYSPPLTQSVALVTSDKAGGVIFMQNNAPTSAHDFSVWGQMQYFDYDPKTGVQVLIGDTTASSPKNVNHGQTVNWAIPNQPLVGNVTIPTGHMVHVALTIGLSSGNPGTYGSILYNGPSGSSTEGLFPQNRSQVLSWPLGTLTAPPSATISTVTSVPANSAGNIASVPNTAGAAYTWSITNGTITAGQGTSQITWSAGASGVVGLQVSVTTGCMSSGMASVGITASALSLPQTVLSVVPSAGGMQLTCAGTAARTYVVQATASLQSPVWINISTNSAGSDGLFRCIDTDAGQYPMRFYRTYLR